ncbi:MAG TPA: gliding motility-associated C-terminal domain-containing protein [Flavisolibacter sp.]|nr:gliding motility-associated C-terminal domain-containing protein [Flavisolibacter sp.]
MLHLVSIAQCPPNIDFESGNFDGWTCYTGYTAAVNGQNEINLSISGPTSDRHTMYTANSGLFDTYGNFPVNCPNGSGHSIRLGNDKGGGEAEGISYEFTIPANRNVYSLMYYYAVVFQDPNHQEFQQPRMVVEITNVTDNTLISCSSLTFIPYGSNVLPGFFVSSVAGDDGTPIWCKDWSAVTINLNGHAGKTIRLFFKTADCTFRRHFGYAYIDVNSECSDEFVGASYCPDDTAVNVVGPYGYQSYTWRNSIGQLLGSNQTIHLAPPPPPGTTLSLEIVPYSGYGCNDTLYAKMIDTLKVFARAGPDQLSCNKDPVQLGTLPKANFVYNWSPAIGLSDANISNPLATPDITTKYVLTSRSLGGGCRTTDTVVITASSISNKMNLIGKDVFCAGFGDSAVLKVDPSDSIQWFKDNLPIKGAVFDRYKVTQSGSYYAVLISAEGCVLNTQKQPIFIDKARPGITYPVEYAVINLPYRLAARSFGSNVLWSPGIYLDDATNVSPVFKGAVEELYTIDIKTNTGCVTVDTQLVKVIKGVDIYVPTAFTPNGDGLNELLRPTLMGVKELQYFKVYNRWGQLVFETKTKREGWNGRINGAPQTTQAVVWELQAIGVDGKTYTQRGTSVLVR